MMSYDEQHLDSYWYDSPAQKLEVYWDYIGNFLSHFMHIVSVICDLARRKSYKKVQGVWVPVQRNVYEDVSIL